VAVLSALAVTGRGVRAQAAPVAADVMHRRISIDVTNVGLRDALLDIARQGGVGIIQGDSVAADRRSISVHLKNVTVEDALRSVLKGSGYRSTVTTAGVIVIERDARRAAADSGGTGVVVGRVRDSLTATPVMGAVVTVRGTSRAAVTNDSGAYMLREVPAGVRTLDVRLVGYAPSVREVMVADSQFSRTDISLHTNVNSLQEMVTTATGPRRRIELGNDITTLNADSIVATQPISTVTDLLEGRVAGLEVQHTSGTPGDPSRLRLRGAGSVYRSNDPIVIVDGVRVYAAQSDARSQNLTDPPQTSHGGTAAPSPLDEIDPNSIETVEVLKGPSASTLYGADAANGVIVITTKRGRPGKARWNISADGGLSYMPGSYPENYYRWGHNIADNAPRYCAITDHSCVGDSLVTFQILSNPHTTVLGQGHRSALTLGVSGGSSTIQYSITGSGSDEVGLIKLPDAEVERYVALQGSQPPDWMKRPDDFKGYSGTGRVTAQIGTTADVSVFTSLGVADQRRSSLDNALGDLAYTYLNPATGTYQIATSAGYQPATRLLDDYYTKTTDQATTVTSGISVSWRPLSWLTGSADAGINLINRQDEQSLARGLSVQTDSVGFDDIGLGTSRVKTVDLRAVVTAPPIAQLKFQTAVGANYQSTQTEDLLTSGGDIPYGATSVNQSAAITSSENRSDVTSFGVYIEPSLAWRQRLFLSTGVRFDGGNTFGQHASLAGFPKVSLSYLLSSEPFFPFKSLFNTLRLRSAYGQAGVQPGDGDRLRLYARTRSQLDSQPVDITQIQTLGNTDLRPERSEEIEYGFDADVLGDRVTLSVTGYRKTRDDALMIVPLPPSVYGGGSQLQNIGVIRNTGFEVSLGMQLVRSDPITWSAQVLLSHNQSLVVSLGPGVTPFTIDNGRVQAGYPLFGIWARPILGYADANHDGVIEPSEVQIGDSAAYMGSPDPKYQASFQTGVALFRGALRIDVNFTYEHGLTQINGAALAHQGAARGFNDPTAPPGQQAQLVVLSPFPAFNGGLSSSISNATPYGAIQTVSTLRFNSLSVAYNLPASLARHIGASAMSIALQGTNLGLFTDYRGKDPDVNVYSSGNGVLDTGQLPTPRSWQLRVSCTY
jgi:TonB-linked SusC/RagA family outer membrane protein